MDVWIGLVGVSCLPGNDIFNGSKGAYVNALALATSVDTFQGVAFEFEDVEPFAKRQRGRELGQALIDVAEEAGLTGKVCFSTFHTYPHADA